MRSASQERPAPASLPALMDRQKVQQKTVIEVDVRQEHIDRGNVVETQSTPIVLAMNEQHPPPDGFFWRQTSPVSLRLIEEGVGEVARLALPPISRERLESHSPSPVTFPIVLQDEYGWREWAHEKTVKVVDVPWEYFLEDD